MTNPHPATPTDIDIRAAADRVIAQLQQGQHAEALRLLERERAEERSVVQEALDRYVAVGAQTELDELRGSGALQASPELASTLERLQLAAQPPRMPDYNGRDADAPNELVDLTDAQKYDIYASIVETRGNQAARDALRDEESVLLGLRRETSTVASMDDLGQRGTGVYDDHIVVLRRDASGERHWFIADRASTEPTAQYDERARPGPDRENTPYSDVAWRRPQGEDVNGDGTRDLGRMAEGTIEMLRTTHPARGNPRDFSLRPTPEQVTAPRNADLVQRDTNADGWFTQNDVNGVQALNDSFKVHSGSRNNTDSAGCQTIHPEDYDQFIEAVRANPQQTRWQYVLTSTEGGIFHNVEQGQEQDQPQRPGPNPERNSPAEDRQGMLQPGPFNDPVADRYFAAVMAGDSDLADRIAIEFARSPEGQQFARMGDELLAQQQALEQRQLEERQRAHQAPAMQI
ncbi:hypothetical protein [Marilutibacter chinensis]|uniref:Peptidoglycan-binding protein n=1 Tax=Marilutibacter chinensis TaxID=2912247 RepID=A0ABS9HWL2_9GAMM|nr:hypothetical protein [Lysobacter chinensis]MCF7222574.1 hypothetical protein [Lysobacter chinensis]